MDILSVLWTTVLPFLVILTIVVFVHEFGHFIIARLNGVKVDVFSIGFGKELFGWYDRHGTRWRVSLLPLGGYVKFFGDANEASGGADTERTLTEEEKKVAFHHKRVGQRFSIVLAGPAFNFIFAILVFAAVFMSVGQPITPPVVGGVSENSAAAEAGLQPGDRVVEINGEAVTRFEDILRLVPLTAEGEAMDVVVQRGDERREYSITPRVIPIPGGDGTTERPKLGIEVSRPTVIGAIDEDGPAAAAGFEVGDRIVAINGAEVQRFQDVARIIGNASAGDTLSVEILRDGDRQTLTVSPMLKEVQTAGGATVERLTVGIGPLGSEMVRLGPVDAVGQAFVHTGNVVTNSLTAIGQMIAGARGTEDLGGPVRIAQFSGQAAQSGLVSAIMFVALLSVALGLFNLFPVPMLDGGHLLFYGIEALRGQPLSEQVQEYGFRLGLVLVLTLMVFVTWNDIVRLIEG